MRYVREALFTIIVAAVALLVILLLLGASARPGGAASPAEAAASMEDTATVPVPLPASTSTVRWAKKQRLNAVKAWVEWNRYRAAFKLKAVPFNKLSSRLPARAEAESVWRDAGRAWRIDRDAYRARAQHLHERMISTKGGGALRWRPLIRWWWPEWSESQVYLMAHIVWHESSGRPFAWNGAGSGAFGLFQLLPKPAGVWGPFSQARAARQIKYDHGGLGHWAGCYAFSCGGGCGIY